MHVSLFKDKSDCFVTFSVHNGVIQCQPRETSLHGGQSRLRHAEQGKDNKKRKFGNNPPPGRKKNDKIKHKARITSNIQPERHHVAHPHA